MNLASHREAGQGPVMWRGRVSGFHHSPLRLREGRGREVSPGIAEGGERRAIQPHRRAAGGMEGNRRNSEKAGARKVRRGDVVNAGE